MVAKLPPGRHTDGHGLQLLVKPSGTRSWVQRVKIKGALRIDMGLGSYPLVSLAEAREDAIENRKLARRGIDPRGTRQPSLAMVADIYVNEVGTWKDGGAAFRQNMANHVTPKLGSVKVDMLSAAMVRDVILKLADAKPATAKIVNGQVGMLIGYAIGEGWRTDPNPCPAIRNILSKRGATTKHHDAVDWRDAPMAFDGIREAERRTPKTKAAMMFLALTAARTAEVRTMRWADVDGSVWTKPATATKTKREHRVPLSGAARALVDAMPRQGEFVFGNGKPMGARVLGEFLSANGIRTHTPHGWRSTFTDWARNHGVDPDVREQCLGHVTGSAVVQAYARDDLLEQRAAVMHDWAEYLSKVRIERGTLAEFIS